MKKPGPKTPLQTELAALETKYVVRRSRKKGCDEYEVNEVHVIFRGDLAYVFPKFSGSVPQRADLLDPTQVYDTREEARSALLQGAGKVRWVCVGGHYTGNGFPRVFQARVLRSTRHDTYHYQRLDTFETGYLNGPSFYETKREALEEAARLLGRGKRFHFEEELAHEEERHFRAVEQLKKKKVGIEKLLGTMRGAHVKTPDNYRKPWHKT